MVAPLALSLIFIPAGVGMVVFQPKTAETADHLGVSRERFRLIGLAELAGAAGLLAGLRFEVLGALAAACLVLLTVGAAVTHRRAGDPWSKAVPALVCSLGSAVTAVLFLA